MESPASIKKRWRPSRAASDRSCAAKRDQLGVIPPQSTTRYRSEPAPDDGATHFSRCNQRQAPNSTRPIARERTSRTDRRPAASASNGVALLASAFEICGERNVGVAVIDRLSFIAIQKTVCIPFALNRKYPQNSNRVQPFAGIRSSMIRRAVQNPIGCEENGRSYSGISIRIGVDAVSGIPGVRRREPVIGHSARTATRVLPAAPFRSFAPDRDPSGPDPKPDAPLQRKTPRKI